MKRAIVVLLLANIGYAVAMMIWLSLSSQPGSEQDDISGVIAVQLLGAALPDLAANKAVELVPFARCTALGPWLQRDQADRALLQLRAAGMAGGVRHVDVEKGVYWQLVLTSMSSRDDALSALRAMLDHGHSAHLVSDDDGQYAVVVGRFASDATAEHVMRRLPHQGVAMGVESVRQQHTEYWVSLTDVNEDMLGVFLIGNAEILVVETVCE